MGPHFKAWCESENYDPETTKVFLEADGIPRDGTMRQFIVWIADEIKAGKLGKSVLLTALKWCQHELKMQRKTRLLSNLKGHVRNLAIVDGLVYEVNEQLHRDKSRSACPSRQASASSSCTTR